MHSATTRITEFSLALLRHLQAERENILISPISLLTALTMTANGAAGETLRQIEQTVGLPLAALNEICCPPAENDAQLHMANAIWMRKDGITFLPEFLNTNKARFGAELHQAPMNDETRREINGWIAEQTDGMIRDMIRYLDPSCAMCLINALAFDAAWAVPYTAPQVRSAVFTDANGNRQETDFLFGTEYSLLRTKNAVGFVKPYNARFAFAALCPCEGSTLTDLLAAHTASALTAALAAPRHVRVRTAMPRFSSSTAAELSEPLKALGMPDAFSARRADFSRMAECTRDNLSIGRVLHNTHIDVTEQGTRAGAATVVEMLMRCARMEESAAVIVDRPFLYLIFDRETHIPLFLGTTCRI